MAAPDTPAPDALPPVRTLADVQALEAGDWASALPAASPYGLIARAARRWPQRTALAWLGSGAPDAPVHAVPYAQLLARIHQAANLFRAMGVGPQDAVAILAPNTPATHFALWGAQLAGRACPINYLLAPEHIAGLLRAAGARVLVALAPNAELDLSPTLRQVLALCPLPLVLLEPDWPPRQADTAWAAMFPGASGFAPALAAQPEALAFAPVLAPNHVAACFHTGGTTGAPKLALHTQGNEAHTGWFAHAYYGFDADTVEVNGFPLFHVAGAFVYGLALLAIGATQVLPTLTGMRNAGFVAHYWRHCERLGVTALACVPTILAQLCQRPVDADTGRIQVAYTGGSPLPSELAARFEAHTGIAVRNILGMTECAGLLSIEPRLAPRTPGSTGLRLPYSQVQAVPWQGGAARLDAPCAPGQTGVIVARGPHVSPGYSDAARNAGMFAEGGWLVSGDLGHLDAAGRLYITGRAKDVIIRGSHNIDPGLVEEAFLAHPAVALCAVVGEPDAHAGELPVAFVTLKPQAASAPPIAPDALLAAVAPTVYERPAVPKRVTVLEALPLTAIGKVYKPALRRMACEVKLREVLAGLVPPEAVRVEEDAAGLGGLVAYIAPSEHAGAPEEAVLRRLGAMAVTVRLG